YNKSSATYMARGAWRGGTWGLGALGLPHSHQALNSALSIKFLSPPIILLSWSGLNLKQTARSHHGVIPPARIELFVHCAESTERRHGYRVFEAGAALTWPDHDHGGIACWRLLRCDSQRALPH